MCVDVIKAMPVGEEIGSQTRQGEQSDSMQLWPQ